MEQIKLARQIGLVVRDERTRRGLTQQQLADAAGVSRGFVVRLEKGSAAAVYPDKLLDVLGALRISLYLDRSEEAVPIEADDEEPDAGGGRNLDGLPVFSKTLANSFSVPAMTEAVNSLVMTDAMEKSIRSLVGQTRIAFANMDFASVSPLFQSRNHRGTDEMTSEGESE